MAVSILSQSMIRKKPAPHLMRGGYRFSGTNDFVCPKIMLQLYCSASGGTMTIAEWCIFGTVILYLLTIAPVKAIGFRRFDNSKPRDPAFYDNPIAARALGAHLNGIETFPFFATAVLLAEFRAGPQRLIDELAVLFLIVRIAYVFTYLGDRPTLRTILWNIGFAINVAIFFMPAIRGFLPV